MRIDQRLQIQLAAFVVVTLIGGRNGIRLDQLTVMFGVGRYW